jgi:hypothetical protein
MKVERSYADAALLQARPITQEKKNNLSKHI